MARYCSFNDDVVVIVDKQNFPVLHEVHEVEPSRQLLAAFMAANVRAQLESGRPCDCSYEGALAMLSAYQLLPEFHSPGLDYLAELEVRGELRTYLDRVSRRS